MMHWYCPRLTPSRNTALGSGSFCGFFFSPKYPVPQRSESNNIGDLLIQSKKGGEDQESIHQVPHLTQDTNGKVIRGQDNLQIYYSSASAIVLSKGTEPR